jgi:hypothetical protein
MIVAKISGGAARQEENGAPDWRKADWDAMRAALREGEWMRSLRRKGAEEAWNILKERVTGLVSHYVPERRRRNQNRPAGLSQKIIRAIRRKKRLWRTCRDRIPTDEYKDAEKKVQNLIRNAKRRFEKKLASGNGGQKRPFFVYIKKRTQSRPSVGPLKTEDGQTVADSEGMANL